MSKNKGAGRGPSKNLGPTPLVGKSHSKVLARRDLGLAPPQVGVNAPLPADGGKAGSKRGKAARPELSKEGRPGRRGWGLGPRRQGGNPPEADPKDVPRGPQSP